MLVLCAVRQITSMQPKVSRGRETRPDRDSSDDHIQPVAWLAQRDRLGKLLGVSGRCDRIASNFVCRLLAREATTVAPLKWLAYTARTHQVPGIRHLVSRSGRGAAFPLPSRSGLPGRYCWGEPRKRKAA